MSLHVELSHDEWDFIRRILRAGKGYEFTSAKGREGRPCSKYIIAQITAIIGEETK